MSFSTLSQEKPTYKIFSFKYAGPFAGSKALLVYLTEWEEKAQRNYYFWVIQGGDEALSALSLIVFIAFPSGIKRSV